MTDSYTSLWASDLHMNNNLPHARPTSHGRTDRMEDQIKLWARFREVALKTKAEDFWIPGDLFDHGKADAVTLAETARLMADFPVDQIVVPGNHDAHSIHGGRFNLEAFGWLASNVKYVGGRRPEPVQPRPWLVFWPVEFMPVDETMAAIRDIRERIADGLPATNGERMDILVLHNAIVGCSHVGWVCDSGLDADEVCEGFDQVIAGHFHDHQTFGPDGRGMYLGAPMHHRFDDAGRRAGFWVMKFAEGKGVSKKWYSGKAPTFHNVDHDDPTIEDIVDALNPGDYLRIKVTATHSEWVGLRRDVLDVAEQLRAEHGLRVSVTHKPVYHHTARIKTHGKMGVSTMEENVDNYVMSADVDTTGLDLKKLKAIGRMALAEARSKT